MDEMRLYSTEECGINRTFGAVNSPHLSGDYQQKVAGSRRTGRRGGHNNNLPRFQMTEDGLSSLSNSPFLGVRGRTGKVWGNSRASNRLLKPDSGFALSPTSFLSLLRPCLALQSRGVTSEPRVTWCGRGQWEASLSWQQEPFTWRAISM